LGAFGFGFGGVANLCQIAHFVTIKKDPLSAGPNEEGVFALFFDIYFRPSPGGPTACLLARALGIDGLRRIALRAGLFSLLPFFENSLIMLCDGHIVLYRLGLPQEKPEPLSAKLRQ
jgi:hypothetical protein